jgi:hypothetical protein
MPARNKSSRTGSHAMLNHKTTTQITTTANLKLTKKQEAERANRQAAVKHVCPICSWESEAIRPRKKNDKTAERSH